MTMIIYLFIFIFGLIIGSFLNCVIFRIEKNEKFLFSRSYCPNCKHQLNWRDLIPIFSFLFLKGKCRYCKKKISIQYPLVEISTALMFLLIFKYQFLIFNEFQIFNFPNLLVTCYLLLVTSLFIIIFVYDLRHYLIPDRVVFSGIGLALLYNLFRISPQPLIFKGWATQPILNGLWSNLGLSVLPSLLFLAIILISRGKWMGLGDFKLAIFMGLFLGFPNILIALFSGVFLGAIIGVGLVALNKKKLSSEIPFGPFLITGTFIALFWSSRIINWYLSIL